VLTQQQLADAAKLHRVTIARLEEGRQRPTAASVWKIARALRWPAFRVISAGLAAGDNRGHSLGEEKASKALPSVVAWAGSVAAGGASCQAAARRLREVGDVVIVQDPEVGLGVEDLYQVREHERRLGAHVHDEPGGREPPQREPDTVAAVGGAFENPPGGEVADQSQISRCVVDRGSRSRR